jgi:hypothetical protein
MKPTFEWLGSGHTYTVLWILKAIVLIFMQSPNSDLTAAKLFLQLALCSAKEIREGVINVSTSRLRSSY